MSWQAQANPGLRKPQGNLNPVQKSANGIVNQAVGAASEALQSRKTEPTDRPHPGTLIEGLNDRAW